MFHSPIQITPARVADVLEAAEQAGRAVPPAFPLEATVAVNPFLGQSAEPLAHAAARLARVAGIALTRPRADFRADIAAGRITPHDLEAALAAASASDTAPADMDALMAALGQDRPQPRAIATVAQLAASQAGTDWPSVIDKTFGLWAAGYFDRGQALWSPAPGQGAYAAWRAWASNDLTPEIAGLKGFCAHVAEAPDTPDRAILRACDSLSISVEAAQSVFHRLLLAFGGGWAQHARWLLWQAELAGGTDTTLGDLLAMALVWEEALLKAHPQIEPLWAESIAAHAAPVAPSADDVVDAILQDAAERAGQRRLAARLTGPQARDQRPLVQAAFCIDVRSEVFRRAFESQSPQVETLGFAGFFGLPLAHTDPGSDVVEAHLPVLLNPTVESTSQGDAASEQEARIGARAARAWGRFRQAAVSSFAFVEAAGPFYAGKLVKDALGLGLGLGFAKGHTKTASAPAPRLATDLSAQDKAQTAATVLKAMSLTKGHGRFVLLLGHGAQVTNNPHESAYHCGACGGYTGEVSARLLADLLNDPQARAGLAAQGVDLAKDVVFVAGLHDTTTDEITLYDAALSRAQAQELTQIKGWLTGAGRLARAERAGRFAGERGETLAARALNWAETRPEWGLAGCSAFIAAPRGVTAQADLGGRAFLHSYDWQDDAGFATLELILTAPVVVASWISLQYYGSSVAPEMFGGGNKLIHNVVGGIGVVQGNGGRLRPGLPWQAVHDGAALAHDPLRLSVLIEAPPQAISDILGRHPAVRTLFDNGWLHLFTLQDGRVAQRYCPGNTWADAAAMAA